MASFRSFMILGLAVSLFAAGCSTIDTSEDSSGSPSPGAESSLQPGQEELTPLLISHSGPAVRPVLGSDGRWHLLYNISLQNATSLKLQVDQIQVTTNGETLLDLQGKQATDIVEVLGTRTAGEPVGPAESATAFLTLAFDELSQVPQELSHDVTVSAPQLTDGPITSTGATTPVDSTAEVPVLQPPLEPGSGYVAADGCCTSTRHIRAPLPLNNQLWFSQRYAIDWEQLNAAGTLSTGDTSKSENYIIYGKDVLAVADGTVVHTLDGLPDQKPGIELPGVSIGLDKADGNNIVLDIGNGLFAVYAHLKNESLQVSEGDQVTAGQVIARVGNSGNTLAPHLHFHVMDGPSALAANGMPYTISGYSITGRIKSTEVFDAAETNGTKPATTSQATTHSDELPLDLSIITFPKPVPASPFPQPVHP